MSNRERRARPEVINTNSNETLFYPYSIKINKCSDSCNDMTHMQNYVFLMLLKL